MVYEARGRVVYDAAGLVSGKRNSSDKRVAIQRKGGFLHPLTRKLSDAFRKSSARPAPGPATGDLKANGLSGSCVSIPRENWTKGGTESQGTLARSRSLGDITLSFAGSRQSWSYRTGNKPQPVVSLAHRAPVVRDAKKRNKEPKQRQDSRLREVSHTPGRAQQRPRALNRLSHELNVKQLLPNKAMHIKGFPSSRQTKEVTSPSAKVSEHKKRAEARPRAQSCPRKLNINHSDEELVTLPAVACKNTRPHSRSLPETSSVFFATGVSENELEFVELNRKLDRTTLQASARILNEDGMTMLHKAAQSGFTVLTRFLVNNGISTEMSDSQGWSPLCVALDNGNFNCAQVLVRLGANVNFVGPEGRTILHKMASQGNYKAMEFLVNCQVRLDVEDNHGWPAVHYAFRKKKLKCAALLLSSGADVGRYTAKRVQEYSMATEIINISHCRHGLNDNQKSVSWPRTEGLFSFRLISTANDVWLNNSVSSLTAKKEKTLFKTITNIVHSTAKLV